MDIKTDEIDKTKDGTCGTLYKVTYITNPREYGHMCPGRHEEPYYITVKLKVEDSNRCGGMIFVDEKDRLIILPWSAIITMIPIDEKESD